MHQDVRPHVDAYDLGDGRTVLLLAEGRVVNLVAAEGHPPEVMDLAFGIEALALAWLAAAVSPEAGGKLPVGVHEVPADIDAEAARLVLAAAGTSIDALYPRPAGLPGILAHRVLGPGYLAAAVTACSPTLWAGTPTGGAPAVAAGGRVSSSHPTIPIGYTK